MQSNKEMSHDSVTGFHQGSFKTASGAEAEQMAFVSAPTLMDLLVSDILQPAAVHTCEAFFSALSIFFPPTHDQALENVPYITLYQHCRSCSLLILCILLNL